MSHHRRVVVLSPGGPFVSALMALLARRQTPVDALVLYPPPVPEGGRGPGAPVARMGVLLRRLAGRARRRLYAPPAGAAMRVVRTGALNGERMTRDLARLRPDVVVLAHCGLVASHVLACAGEAVVNVHPGLLPWIRGSSPLGNSLLRGVPLGCSAFRVDTGIDTGRILARRLLAVSGTESAAELRDALFGLWVEMTADLAASVRQGVGDGFEPQARFALCRTLPKADARRVIEQAVQNGLPRTFFEAWQGECDLPGLSLSPAARVRPVPGVPE